MGHAFRTIAARWTHGALRTALVPGMLCGVLVAGCAGTGWLGGGGGGAAPGAEPSALAFDTWRKDRLHCAAQECEHRYALTVTEPGRIRAEVYAPLDPGGPDFALALLDADGEEIARPVEDDARPRRIAYEAEPGTYVLRVSARGADPGPLGYDVVAFHEPPAPSPAGRRASDPSSRPAPPPREPAPTPAPPPPPEPEPEPARSHDVLALAEVLDVEVGEGGATFVLLDRGEPDGVRKAMRGGLRIGDEPIGDFVVVEVYRDGSRARIEGDLQADIGIDTVAEIYR
ncbi:MAG TPA: hypothetical protein ENO23_11290 [Alphaproteobacteria bacterium]|nr:hypothetical protein [Alphaproteobacteria bacterium]